MSAGVKVALIAAGSVFVATKLSQTSIGAQIGKYLPPTLAFPVMAGGVAYVAYRFI